MKVSKEFMADFELSMKHYECNQDEIDYEKQRVRENYEDAAVCYKAIADGIRKNQQ